MGSPMSIFPIELEDKAKNLLERCRAKGIRLGSVESCTGGLLAGLLTQVPGASDVVMSGLVTYANAAKTHLAGVDKDLIAAQGAVSEDVAVAMAYGGLQADYIDLSIALTGIAGPGSDSDTKPAGLVWLAAAQRTGAKTAVITKKCDFGDIGRENVRLASVDTAIDLMNDLLDQA